MGVPFITRQITDSELTKLRLFMSSFTDGSGYEKNPDGSTRPGWRDFERIIAELVEGEASEKKAIFDVLTKPSEEARKIYGISVKSKKFSPKKFSELLDGGRAYMELCNSPAKLWKPLGERGIYEDSFRKMEKAEEIGNSILQTVHGWYQNSGVEAIDLEHSVHLTISYCLPKNDQALYQVHTFPLGFPKGIIWRYKSERCLTGYDPEYPSEVLFDWYALSGGQLKYYPKTTYSRFESTQFSLLEAQPLSLTKKVKNYWPEIWETL